MSSKAARKIQGLYAIMDTWTLANRSFEQVLQQILQGGASVVQYRDKGDNSERRIAQARLLVDMCREHDVISIINDDAVLAEAVGADGVHVGREDDVVSRLRTKYPDLIIGASCYASLDRARRQAMQGASYLAFGSFYPSPTKPAAVRASTELLTQAKTLFDLPLVAIGGVMAHNAPDLIESGADAIAVISAILQADDPRQASTEMASLFD